MTQNISIDRTKLDTSWFEINNKIEDLYRERLEPEIFDRAKTDQHLLLDFGESKKHLYWNNDDPIFRYVIDERNEDMTVYFQFGDNTRQLLWTMGAEPDEVDAKFPDNRLDNVIDCVKAFPSRAGDSRHWHYVAFGLSDLYTTEVAEEQFSGMGFELTFRVAAEEDETTPPDWPVTFIQQFAGYVVENKKLFANGHYINTGGPIFPKTETLIHGFGLFFDPELGIVNACSGDIEMLQLIGLTDKELKAASEERTSEKILLRMQESNPMLVTDYKREEEYV